MAVELDAVPGAGTQLPGRTREHEVLAYRVQLEVADEAELPAYVPDEQALLERVVQPDVKAAIVSLTQFSNGYTIDLAALSQATRAAGKWLIIDAIQAAGQLPIDLTVTPVDFLACGAQKWLLSPWGTGFLYVRRELCQQFAPTFAG